MKPITKYTRSGRINIAYQVYGEGPIDIVYVPGWVSNIDIMWDCPQLVDFFKGIAQVGRLILFDKRGTGLSDRVTELSPLEDRMDDIRAVMDAVGSQRAALFGHSEGGSVSALFAATYPERTIALLTFGVFAKRKYAPEYPWAPTDEERQGVYDMIDASWGSGDMNLSDLAPSMAHDSKFMDWLAHYFRSGASPSAAMVLTKMNTQVDIIDILDTITVPTLLMYRTFDIDVKIGEGRFIHQRIKGSKFVEFDGEDHLFWAGNKEEVLDEISVFLTGQKQTEERYDRMLSTILFTDIVDSTKHLSEMGDSAWFQLLRKHSNIIKKLVHQYRGTLVNDMGDGFLITFDGPSKAVHCGIEIRQAVQELNIQLRIGVHTGECIRNIEGGLAGMAIHVASRVQSMAAPDEILLTQTVKNLLWGTGLEFEDKGRHTLKGIPQEIGIMAVSEKIEPVPVLPKVKDTVTVVKRENPSFLENVLHSIEQHMADEHYSIDILCAEVGVSERQLQRKLKSIANKTPNQMIRSFRLHRAKDMLSEQHEGISEVAYSTGFGSLSYFTKCFKKEFGMAPSDLIVA